MFRKKETASAQSRQATWHCVTGGSKSADQTKSCFERTLIKNTRDHHFPEGKKRTDGIEQQPKMAVLSHAERMVNPNQYTRL